MNHHYGPQVSILDKPNLISVLTNLCSPKTVQPLINQYVKYLYSELIATVINSELLLEEVAVPTRMTSDHPDKLLTAKIINPNQKAICVNLARAGTYPSHLCYEQLHMFLKQEFIRQDHIFAARMTNDDYQVTSTLLDGFKIGGDVDQALVLIPDPMGATGTTIISTIEHYKRKIPGKAKKYIAIHLIITPEYIRRVLQIHPDVKIYALRVDRGLSSPKVLHAEPGLFWDEEKGLNAKDYIVPGAGGFGEIMNNSFV